MKGYSAETVEGRETWSESRGNGCSFLASSQKVTRGAGKASSTEL